MVKAKRRESRAFVLTVCGANGELMTSVWCRSASVRINPFLITQNKPDI